MTPDQIERLPRLLREIVETDRRIGDARGVITAATAVPRAMWLEAKELRERRARLRAEARNQYGRVPLRGDTGPGRPTAARA